MKKSTVCGACTLPDRPMDLDVATLLFIKHYWQSSERRAKWNCLSDAPIGTEKSREVIYFLRCVDSFPDGSILVTPRFADKKFLRPKFITLQCLRLKSF